LSNRDSQPSSIDIGVRKQAENTFQIIKGNALFQIIPIKLSGFQLQKECILNGYRATHNQAEIAK
jgi:hypothetical protein